LGTQFLSKPRPAADEIVIRPYRTKLVSDLIETFRFRGLIASMAMRQFKQEYQGALFGPLWCAARPLTMLAVFTAFRHLADANVGVTLPYAFYLYSGLVLWFFFIAAVESAATALERDAGLIRKVYFPRLVSPLASVGADMMGFLVAATPLAVIMVWFGVMPGWAILALPLLLLQLALLIVGLGAIFSVLSLQGGDWRRGLSLVLYVGLFVSPVIYAPDLIPNAARPIYDLNPMVGPLLAFRAMLADGVPFPVWQWGYAWAVSLGVFAAGMLAFHHFEREMLDRL
jgi:lipopolysaccharide transport system permease protein